MSSSKSQLEGLISLNLRDVQSANSTQKLELIPNYNSIVETHPMGVATALMIGGAIILGLGIAGTAYIGKKSIPYYNRLADWIGQYSGLEFPRI